MYVCMYGCAMTKEQVNWTWREGKGNKDITEKEKKKENKSHGGSSSCSRVL